MSAFEDREKSFENKYKHDQELLFRITARRNKLFGLWVAGLIGLDEAEADAYARAIVALNLDEPGDGDILRRVSADLAAKKVDMSEHRLVKRLEELAEEARQQVTSQ